MVKYNIDFYQLDPKKGDFAPIRHLDGKIANTLVWSPKGRHIVLATIGSSTKFDIEFWDLDFVTDDNPQRKEAEPGVNVQMLGTGEHFGITDIAWDPSGRYLGTSASAWRSTVSHCINPADISLNLDSVSGTSKANNSFTIHKTDSSSSYGVLDLLPSYRKTTSGKSGRSSRITPGYSTRRMQLRRTEVVRRNSLSDRGILQSGTLGVLGMSRDSLRRGRLVGRRLLSLRRLMKPRRRWRSGSRRWWMRLRRWWCWGRWGSFIITHKHHTCVDLLMSSSKQ